jgi:DNA-binding NarL/FixJ family response regulator
MSPTRVLIADSQPMFLDGLRAYAGRVADLDVVATAGTSAEAVAQVRRWRPDVVVLDLELPGGIAVAREIATETGVLAVSDHEKAEHLGNAMAAGAAGYVTKKAQPDDILTAIRVVARGGLYANAALAPRIRRRLSTSAVSVGAFPQLSIREREILTLLARDTAVPAIAGWLGITGKTVRNHVSNIVTKLPARSMADAVRIAREAAL